MAVRKPRKPASTTALHDKTEPMDLTDAPAFIPTPAQIREQMLKLDEWLREYEAESGEFTEEEFEAIEKAWPGSR